MFVAQELELKSWIEANPELGESHRFDYCRDRAREEARSVIHHEMCNVRMVLPCSCTAQNKADERAWTWLRLADRFVK